MFLREQQGLELAGGGGRAFGRALVPIADVSRIERVRGTALRIDWTPDLGAQIGSRAWWRGLFTCIGLCWLAWLATPGFHAFTGAVPPALESDQWEATRAASIAPIATGANTGRRMAANDLVRPLAETPERPEIELAATLGDGDSFTNVLARAGVGRDDAANAARLVSDAVTLGDIRPGTRLALTLGRRPSRAVARPLERLAFRARFDLNLSLARAGDGLAMTRQPIAVDHTPLRLQGLVGSSLYRSVRAAGASGEVSADYLKALASRVSIGRDITAADSFDLIIEQDRAATGETRFGRLLFAGLGQRDHQLQLVRWRDEGAEDWYDAHGQIRHAGAMDMPVPGRITSNFGWRFHPILGFARMHQGVDVAAPYGTPIVAAIDGRVAFAGWHGGHGNFVQLAHPDHVVTGYGHMSRIAVHVGESVRRGQVIGYVGMTGLTTGPHVHWEVIKNGTFINPMSIRYASVSALSDAAMRAFKARVASLLAVKPGGR